VSYSYHVEVFSAEDVNLFGPFGLKLVPSNDTYRCWYFIAEDEESQKEWEEVFSFACRKARPLSRYHRIISEAFRMAFESVRHSYGFFGRLEVHGTEEEMLSEFIIQILHRELLEDSINSVPQGPGRIDKIKRMKMLATRTVMQSTSNTWKKCVSIASPVVKKMTMLSDEIAFDDESAGRFKSIMEVEDNVRVRLTAAVSKIVDPVLIDVATTFCAPLLASIVNPISNAFAEAINGFDSEMQQFLIDNSSSLHNEMKIMGELNCVHRRVSHLSGSFMKCRVILWDMYTTNCSSLMTSSDCGLDAYELYCEICDSVRNLIHNAIHHLGVLLYKQGSFIEGTDPTEYLSEVRTMMRTDAKIMQSNVLGMLLNRSIEPMVQEMIVIPSTEEIQQFNDESGCGVRILNLKNEDIIQTCGERIIDKMICNFLKSLVNEFTSN